MSTDADPKALLPVLLRALGQYPAPVRLPGGRGYANPVELALGIYSGHFRQTSSESTIMAAFVSLTPKVLARGRALIRRVMEAIVDSGGHPPGAEVDYISLLRELSTLAGVFVGPGGAAFAGPFAPQYTAVCDMLADLRRAMGR